MVLFRVLSGLGLGEHAFIALVFVMAGWYLLRGKSVLGSLVATVGTMATITMGVLAVLAVSIILGWFDPRPGVFLGHVTAAIGTLWEMVGDMVIERVTEVVP